MQKLCLQNMMTFPAGSDSPIKPIFSIKIIPIPLQMPIKKADGET
jgi:hypothetical protein